MIVAAVGSAVEAAVSRSVGAAVDKAVEAAMEAAVNDMQAYTNGAEADLLKQIQELCVANNSAARPSEAEGGECLPKGAPEGSAHAFRSSMAVKGAVSSGPYVPPPARGMTELPRPTLSFSSLSARQRRNDAASSSGNSGHGDHRQLIFRGLMERTPNYGKHGVWIILTCSTQILIFGLQ